MSSLEGIKFRPSNGVEGEIFHNNFCDRCEKLFGPVNCKIPLSTMAFDIDEPEYPKEWVYDGKSLPTCTAFENKEKQDGNV